MEIGKHIPVFILSHKIFILFSPFVLLWRCDEGGEVIEHLGGYLAAGQNQSARGILLEYLY